MFRRSGWALLSTVMIFGQGAPALAQYNYPGGYGGFGGWGGGGTVAGSKAAGMGVFAAGAGSYNEQTAEARAQNANTAMQMNEYMYAYRSRNAQEYSKQQQDKVNAATEARTATYQRLHDNPTGEDIHSGDALNIVMLDLVNPRMYTQVSEKATLPVDTEIVRNIVFEYAAKMIAVSLDDLSDRGEPDVLATPPAFQADRATLKAIIAKARKEVDSQGQVSMDTLRAARTTIKSLQDKVAAAFQLGTRQRDESDNFLKALYGLSKMLEKPKIDQFLAGLKKYPATTLGQVIEFMHSFNLRFGAAKTPDQEAAYDQLYPMLAGLRDQAGAQGPNLAANPVPPQDPSKVTNFFSGMHYNHFQPQPDPHGAPPAPGPSN